MDVNAVFSSVKEKKMLFVRFGVEFLGIFPSSTKLGVAVLYAPSFSYSTGFSNASLEERAILNV